MATPRYPRIVSDAQTVIVVGAGAAGLACSRTLAAAGLAPIVLERDTAPGGRIRTDEVDGFLLDRGFQVLPRGYPEARRLLDLDRLDLHDFARGAIVRSDGRFRRVSDPRESPLRGLRTLAGGVVSVKDGAAVLKLLRGRSGETTALEALREAGLSRHAVEAFFAPFLRGVFLEPRLATSSRFLDFVLDAFASAPAALPAQGMGAISAQLAEGLDVRTGTAVAAVGPGTVSLESGETLRAAAVVVATAGLIDEPEHGWNGVTCTYFDAPAAPLPGPWLGLNGEGGPINNLCVPSEVAPSYAPPGRALVSVSTLEHRRGRPGGRAAPAARVVRERGRRLAAPALVPDSRAPCRRTRSAGYRSARFGSRTACTRAVITASTRRSTARSCRAAGPPRPCSSISTSDRAAGGPGGGDARPLRARLVRPGGALPAVRVRRGGGFSRATSRSTSAVPPGSWHP